MRGFPGLSVDNTPYEDHLPTNNSSLSDSDECTPSCSLPNEFMLNLSEQDIRFGHWNINCLKDSKFEQIKLLLSGFTRRQVDILFITETFLKPSMPDCFFTVPGFRPFFAKIEALKEVVRFWGL